MVLWECVLDDWCRQDDPTNDALLHQNWVAVDGLPEAERIVTPAWEHVYRREDCQAFLSGQGKRHAIDKRTTSLRRSGPPCAAAPG